MDFLRLHQLNVMLVLSGICGMLALFVYFTKSLPPRRRHALFFLEGGSMILLMADRFAYIYRGDTSVLGFYMVRICNFLVFFLSLALLISFNFYLKDLMTNEGGLKKVPRRLKLAQILGWCGLVMLVVAQPTHFYYVFDEMNRYHRGRGFVICYLMPFSMLSLFLSIILQYYKRLNRLIRLPMLLLALLPIIATVVQIFLYGLSLTNMSIVGMAILLYLFVLLDLNATVEKAKEREIEFYREEQRQAQLLFTQTAETVDALNK